MSEGASSPDRPKPGLHAPVFTVDDVIPFIAQILASRGFHEFVIRSNGQCGFLRTDFSLYTFNNTDDAVDWLGLNDDRALDAFLKMQNENPS